MPAHERLAAWRIVDANANRAAEGLRVVEEYCRFLLNDAHLTRQYKQLRHDLTDALQLFPPAILAAARETTSDVGTTVTVAQEGQRDSLLAVALASGKRVEQALRVLEEFSKALCLPSAGRFEELRYRAYTLAKSWTLAGDSLQRLADARLYVLVDGCESEIAFERLVRSLVAAGVSILQLRDKRLADRTLLQRARQLRAAAPRGGGTLVVVNDRPDLAVLSDADGVHVGQDELTVREVRQIVGPTMLVGVSTHRIEQARQAALDGASYLGCGPVFPSDTKSFDHFPGLEYLRQVVAEVRLPAFAIGGITQTNLPEVLATGFSRVAVSGSITKAPDADKEARLMLQRLAEKL